MTKAHFLSIRIFFVFGYFLRLRLFPRGSGFFLCLNRLFYAIPLDIFYFRLFLHFRLVSIAFYGSCYYLAVSVILLRFKLFFYDFLHNLHKKLSNKDRRTFKSEKNV